MFDFMIFILINAFWFTLIIGTFTLLSLRVIYSLQGNYSIKERLMIWFMPLSIGFYHLERHKNKLSKIYRVFVVIFFITALLSSLFIMFTEMELAAI